MGHTILFNELKSTGHFVVPVFDQHNNMKEYKGPDLKLLALNFLEYLSQISPERSGTALVIQEKTLKRL